MAEGDGGSDEEAGSTVALGRAVARHGERLRSLEQGQLRTEQSLQELRTEVRDSAHATQEAIESLRTTAQKMAPEWAVRTIAAQAKTLGALYALCGTFVVVSASLVIALVNHHP